MGQGVAGFSGNLLRAWRHAARDPRDKDSHLTAARLGELVGASKAQILDYENGHRLPSPQRLADIADALGVSAELLQASGHRDLSDLRTSRGFTMEMLARRLKISVNTYKRIEREGILPPQRPDVVWHLTTELKTDYNTLHASISRLPAVRDRRNLAKVTLENLVAQALLPGPFEEIAAESSEIRTLSKAFRSKPEAVRRLINLQLSEFRGMAQRRARLQMNVAYPTEPARYRRRRYHILRPLLAVAQEIDTAKENLSELLDRYLLNPLPQACWRLLEDLYRAGPVGVDHSRLEQAAVENARMLFNGLYVEMNLMNAHLSEVGVTFVRTVAPYYVALYGGGVIRRFSPSWGEIPMSRDHLQRNLMLLGLDPRPNVPTQRRASIRR